MRTEKIFGKIYGNWRICHDGHLHPIEIKKTGTPKSAMTASFRFLDKAPLSRGTGAIVCMAESLGALSADTLVFPAWGL